MPGPWQPLRDEEFGELIMTKICCVCRRVEQDNHWKNDYIFSSTERVSHGYCPLCFDVIMSELTDYYAENNTGIGTVKPAATKDSCRACA